MRRLRWMLMESVPIAVIFYIIRNLGLPSIVTLMVFVFIHGMMNWVEGTNEP